MNSASTNIHATINTIWSDILGFNIEEDNQNFFALGGSSMQAFEIITRINDAFKVDLSIMDFFDNLTIRHQVDLLASRAGH